MMKYQIYFLVRLGIGFVIAAIAFWLIEIIITLVPLDYRWLCFMLILMTGFAINIFIGLCEGFKGQAIDRLFWEKIEQLNTTPLKWDKNGFSSSVFHSCLLFPKLTTLYNNSWVPRYKVSNSNNEISFSHIAPTNRSASSQSFSGTYDRTGLIGNFLLFSIGNLENCDTPYAILPCLPKEQFGKIKSFELTWEYQFFEDNHYERRHDSTSAIYFYWIDKHPEKELTLDLSWVTVLLASLHTLGCDDIRLCRNLDILYIMLPCPDIKLHLFDIKDKKNRQIIENYTEKVLRINNTIQDLYRCHLQKYDKKFQSLTFGDELEL